MSDDEGDPVTTAGNAVDTAAAEIEGAVVEPSEPPLWRRAWWSVRRFFGRSGLADWLMVVAAGMSAAAGFQAVSAADRATAATEASVDAAERSWRTAELALNRETRQEAYVELMQRAYAYHDAWWCESGEAWCSEPSAKGEALDEVMDALVAVRLAGSDEVVGNVRGCLYYWTSDPMWKVAQPGKPFHDEACSVAPVNPDAMTQQLDVLTLLMTQDVGAARN